MNDFSKILETGKKYPKSSKILEYGTAGFRSKSDDLHHVLFRMGILATLRSKLTKCTIGMMITASHNPECDNGVKLIDPLGEMLHQDWEPLATKLANCDTDEIPNIISDIIKTNNISFQCSSSVIIGRDTRSSSIILTDAAREGIASIGGHGNDYGLVTTPVLHYLVRCINSNGKYGIPSEEGYFKKLTNAFRELRNNKDSYNANYVPVVYFDGANGVGGVKIKDFKRMIGDLLEILVYNDDIISHKKLNYQCGADYVKVNQMCPDSSILPTNARGVSVDGDADRIVYYYLDCDRKFHLLDGDRIAALVATYLIDIVSKIGFAVNIGVVQTAYANGNSTQFLTEQLKIPVAMVKTGVKHLHHKAMEYDIGIYFEANGHGTILFSEQLKCHLKEMINDDCQSESNIEAKKLFTFIDMVNETVGDALSDLLIVELILCNKGWNIQDWEHMYTDLPNRQLKVAVKLCLVLLCMKGGTGGFVTNSRNVIVTTDAERRCILPDGLQEAIDVQISKCPYGRAFVRPSGTEDVVRIYAESHTQPNADILAFEVAKIVYRYAGGVGSLPSLSV